ncbi:MAG: oxidoreductase [Planctomycetaceae bacterium]|nr:oxidoreductase [Planctomycetaceae bacterium]
MSNAARKPKLGVFKFASCDGCQLSLLDAEDQLLDVVGLVDIAYFLEATSKIGSGPYDVALVEGSITTPHDEERIQEIRQQSKFLMTIGACATAGGIQALRNWADKDEFVRAVYASPEYISSLETSTAIADHVTVDFELRGCPINQYQLIEVIQALVGGHKPRTRTHCVCMDCKQRGNVCITVATGEPCLGPLTQSGCGAICPTYDRGCYGCYGPAKQIHAQSLTDHLIRQGSAPPQLVPLLRNFNSNAEPFRNESNRIESMT